MKDWKNTLFGWVVFLLALLVYTLTLEPTVSFWDCGEFIASSFKLQVGHPPGAPFFQIVQRVFALVAPGVEQVAFMMNFFSAVASAATVMFLYWTIILLIRRFFTSASKNESILIYASGLIGSLTFAFTDSFWFSAVEAEVYAFSSLFTAVVFWAILKWEREADQPHANRWIVLIAYLIGLSIGVHLLNLLAIPAIALVWYFKKHKPSIKGIVLTLIVSALAILLIMFGIVEGTPRLAEGFDVFFVNTLNMPFNSGLLFFMVLLSVLLVGLIYYTHRKKKTLLNLVFLSIAVIYIGFSSYAMIIIRARANPPMNENNPENAYFLMKYLNRSQYGSTPLITGYYYNAPATSVTPGKQVFYPKDGKYIKVEGENKYTFDDRFKTVFPRLYSPQDSHIHGYRSWGRVKGRPVNVYGETEYVPTFTENLRFFFSYQINHMYVRYFMWNFSGRQNDKQGHGDLFNGNWLTGIGFIDKARLGHNGTQPSSLSNPETTNRYFMLPFLLGVVGLFFHYKKNKQGFWVVMLLFFMTGIAIVLYLNQPPYQPRERDYAYAGSFYTFAIWIGLGVMALSKTFEKWLKGRALIPAIAISSIVPILVLSQNYHDHDRSGRYIAQAMGKNYLNSCEKNAILFTYGDNDTFPLWYAQDVEGVRTDVRVCNVTLLNSDWYIDQMKRKAYGSGPLPITMDNDKYAYNTRNTVFVRNDIESPVELSTLMNIVLSDNPRTKVQTQAGRSFDFFPTKQFKITVDKEKVLKTGTVPQQKAHLIEDSIIIYVDANFLTKSDIAILDMLANNNWERPVYFDLSVVQTTNLIVDQYLRNEGFAYRFVPIKSDSYDDYVDTEILYPRLMEQFEWGNMGSERIFIDQNLHLTTEIIRIKRNFHYLADALIKEGSIDKAKLALDKVYEIMPLGRYYTSYNDIVLAHDYFKIRDKESAQSVLGIVANECLEKIEFYLSLGSKYINHYQREVDSEIKLAKELMSVTENMGFAELRSNVHSQLEGLLARMR
jgi:hypothetical protein